MGLFGNKREKCDKGDKCEYNSSSKGARSGYGPPALVGNPPASFFGNVPYFDGFGQAAPQGKMGKYGKFGSPSKSMYGVDPMQQAMFLPPQAQAAAMFQMQQYMQGQGGPGSPFATVLPPIQMPLNAAQPGGLLPPGQAQPYFAFPAQQFGTGFFDPTNGQFPQQQQQQQQPGAFAPYQQANFYDPTAVGGFVAPYGYMPSAF